MNPQQYNIVVTLREIEGESVYEGRVLEFPDVRVYESSSDEAYSHVSEVIGDLIEMAKEIGHDIPIPLSEETEVFSGKMTFRPGRHLHRMIAEAAKRDGLSQNQLLCNLVSYALSEQELAGTVLRRIDFLADLVGQREEVYLPRLEQGQLQTGANIVVVPPFGGVADVTSAGMFVDFGFAELGENEEITAPMSLVARAARDPSHG